MSCDNLARHIITLLTQPSAEGERAQLQAVYDQPATLRAGEDREALRRAAKGLLLLARARGAFPPAHLDLDTPRSRAAVRFGRLALALSELDRRREAPTPARGPQARSLGRCRVCGQFADHTHPCPYPAPTTRVVAVPDASMADQVLPVITALEAAGGTCYFVGGVGRDLLLGQAPKDADLEVHGLEAPQVLAVAQRFGKATIPKKGFPVVRLTASLGGKEAELDLALPRTEQPTAQGGKQGFTTYADPHLGLHIASLRRDVTIGAIAGRYDPVARTMELIDCHGGIADLQARVLRAVNPNSFSDDPTRVLRMMMLAARLEMTVEPETAKLALAARSQYEAGKVTRSEQWAEWYKMVTKGVRPSLGLQALQDTGWLACYPHLAALVGCEQDAWHHPEGDVWTHTKHVADQAAAIAQRDGLKSFDRQVLVLAAICHDLAKPETTEIHWEDAAAGPGGAAPAQGDGPPWVADGAGGYHRRRVSQHKHEQKGVPLAEAFLQQIGAPNDVIAQVRPLVRLHLRHIPLTRLQAEIAELQRRGADTTAQEESLNRQIRRLSAELAPASLAQLLRLIEADVRGRPPLEPQNPCAGILERAAQLAVSRHAPKPLLVGHGERLIAEGLTRPGPEMGRLIRAAYEAQLDGEITTLDEAVAWVRRRVAA